MLTERGGSLAAVPEGDTPWSSDFAEPKAGRHRFPALLEEAADMRSARVMGQIEFQRLAADTAAQLFILL
jgi:hypothetical protein